MARYARKLTKQELIDGGITNITVNGRIFKNGEDITDYLSLNPRGYKVLFIYDRDENGCYIKQNLDKRYPGHYTYKLRSISLNRAIYAWFNDIVEDGFVVDHKDNNKDNYDLTNLQILTPQDNVNKEKRGWNIKETKCNMKKARSFYTDKLEKYLIEYEKAKAEGNAEYTHTLRSNISQLRARIRYWDSHKEEYYEYMKTLQAEAVLYNNWKEDIKNRKLIAYIKKEAKKDGDLIKWKQLIEIKKNWNNYTLDLKEKLIENILK